MAPTVAEVNYLNAKPRTSSHETSQKYVQRPPSNTHLELNRLPSFGLILSVLSDQNSILPSQWGALVCSWYGRPLA